MFYVNYLHTWCYYFSKLHYHHYFQTPNLTLTRSAMRVDFSHHVIFVLSTLSLTFENRKRCLCFGLDESFGDTYLHKHHRTTKNVITHLVYFYCYWYKNYYHWRMWLDELLDSHQTLYYVIHSYFYFVHCNYSFYVDTSYYHLHFCYTFAVLTDYFSNY